MDYYDIFKKLTRGCKFTAKQDKSEKKKNKELVAENKSGSAKFEGAIKQEKAVEEENYYANGDEPITLLGSMQASQSGEKRGKKRKATGNILDGEKKQRLLEQEKINQYRNENNISVVGRHVPEPAKTFEEFAVDEDIIESLVKCGYKEPTPIQKQAVPIMLQGRQLLACAPTGSGKTAAFLVPVIQHLKGPQKNGFRCLIVCPTRELAKQTQRECERLCESRGLRTHVINKINDKAVEKFRTKSGLKFDILITTPNRVCFLMKQDPPAISLKNVEWLIIDEADKLFETGVRSFRDQIDEILQSCAKETRKIAMFSATHTPAVAKWCVHNMKGLIRVTVGHRNAATDLVDQKLVFVGCEQGKLIEIRNMVRKGVLPPVLIFVQSKERALQLAKELIFDGLNVDAIHADRTQQQRDEVVKKFREGKIWFLICTELMARGIDFKGVNLVINYDFPPSAISYVHRVGRAGRAGRKGNAVTFFTIDDFVNLRSIATVIKQSGCEVPEYILKMKKRPRKERKNLEKSAPKREDITTKPKQNWRRRKHGKDNTEKKANDSADGFKKKAKGVKNIKNGVVHSAKKKLKKKKVKSQNNGTKTE